MAPDDELGLGSAMENKEAGEDVSGDGLLVRILESAARNAAAIFLSAVVIVVLIGVIARYVLSISLPWVEEVSRLLLVWLTFLGAAAATARRAHIRVDTIYGRLTGRSRQLIEGASVLLTLLALVILVYASRNLFGPSAATASPGSGIQAGWTRIALPIAAVLMMAFLIVELRDIVRGRVRKVQNDIAHREEV